MTVSERYPITGRTRNPSPFLVLAIFLVLGGLAGTVSAAQQLTMGSAQIGSGDIQSVTLTLDKADAGLSGYTFVVIIGDPAIARIESWTPPTWADMTQNGTLPAAAMNAKAAALTVTRVPAGSRNIPLGTATIRGLSPGTTAISVSLTRLEDNNGDEYIPSTTVADGTITVTGSPATATVTPLALPGQANLPEDPLGAGMDHDVNGDGSVSFSDVSLYFSNFEWIQANEPVALFDYNKNGIIDFGDIVALNEMV